MLRLCEHQSVEVAWPPHTRAAVAAAVADWQQTHRLDAAPLSFEGSGGAVLRAAQFVGTIHAGGVTVEIYPKLDKALIAGGEVNDQRAASVMTHLAWMLARSGYGELIDAGDAPTEASAQSFTDLLAWLYARRLRAQLTLGLPQHYTELREDLPLLRGRVRFSRHATALFGRPDVLACEWEEFTADTPLARVLASAARLMLVHAQLPAVAQELSQCLSLLTEASAVTPALALADAGLVQWSRLNARWRRCFDLAVTVLKGAGQQHYSGSGGSFVYLLDMNRVFESYCRAWLEDQLWDGARARVQREPTIGYLLQRSPGGLRQLPDFFWLSQERCWIADAKYKLPETADHWPRIDDVRQLICYGQLAQMSHPGRNSQLLMLYPTTGKEERSVLRTFDGQPLTLCAVPVLNPCQPAP